MAMLNLNFLDQKGGWIYEFGVQERTELKVLLDTEDQDKEPGKKTE